MKYRGDLEEWFSGMVWTEIYLISAELITQFICCHCLVFEADSRNCGSGERESQSQLGLRPFCISIHLASLDLGLAQYQYELKLFKWTIQSTDYKWRKCRIQIFTLYCAGHCTLLHGFKTVLGYLFLRKGWCPVARYHQRKIIFETFFFTCQATWHSWDWQHNIPPATINNFESIK